MAWDFNSVLRIIPDEKKDYYQNLYMASQILDTLSKSESNAILVRYDQLDALLLKTFELTFTADEFHLPYFEDRLKRLLNKCKKCTTQADEPFFTFLVYFPGVNLYILHPETKVYVGRIRIPYRTEPYYGHHGA